MPVPAQTSLKVLRVLCSLVPAVVATDGVFPAPQGRIEDAIGGGGK